VACSNHQTRYIFKFICVGFGGGIATCEKAAACLRQAGKTAAL
jgi:hypothetical protein